MDGISRRDFVNGVLLAAGASLLNSHASPARAGDVQSSNYPPASTGLRGSHPGSNVHAHSLAWGERSDWGLVRELSESFDLVVVGGGLSGLSAAYFYQKKHGRNASVLILENHDDFGGHAKRNEHTINGNTRITYGGSQTLVEPQQADKPILDLFEDVGIDLKRFETAYDRAFYRRHELGAVTYFSKPTFGQDKLVRHPFCNYPNYVEGLLKSKLSHEEAAAQAPLTDEGRAQLLRVLKGGLHVLDLPSRERTRYARNTRYFDYLREDLGVDDPLVMKMARHSALDWASTGTDLMTMASAKACGAMGFAPVEVYDKDNPYIHHFPDGNAGVARALVKKMIPQVAKGQNAEELVPARFNYAELDRPGNTVRIRLNSTVIRVSHDGDPETADGVLVNYVCGKETLQVRARGAVMACYNMIVPHIVKELPGEQADALKLQRKSPLQYTTVGLKNWESLKTLGIGLAMCPGNWHQAVLMDFPVSMGGYRYADKSSEPCAIQMISCPYGEVGAPRQEQFSEARHRMLELKFGDYEDEIRSHLTGMLGDAGFVFDRDVQSITVNRWAHGYAAGGPGNSTRIGRRPFGRITIANADSAASADVKDAMMAAHRAVNELPEV